MFNAFAAFIGIETYGAPAKLQTVEATVFLNVYKISIEGSRIPTFLNTRIMVH